MGEGCATPSEKPEKGCVSNAANCTTSQAVYGSPLPAHPHNRAMNPSTYLKKKRAGPSALKKREVIMQVLLTPERKEKKKNLLYLSHQK